MISELRAVITTVETKGLETVELKRRIKCTGCKEITHAVKVGRSWRIVDNFGSEYTLSHQSFQLQDAVRIHILHTMYEDIVIPDYRLFTTSPRGEHNLLPKAEEEETMPVEWIEAAMLQGVLRMATDFEKAKYVREFASSRGLTEDDVAKGA